MSPALSLGISQKILDKELAGGVRLGFGSWVGSSVYW